MRLDRWLEFIKRHWLWIAVALIAIAHVIIFLKLFVTGSFDVELYYNYASKIMSGQMPYRDFAIEYPPGAVLVFLLPRLFSGNINTYYTGFAVEMLAFDLACLLMMVPLARRLRISSLGTVLVYSAAVIAVGSIMVERYDLAPAALSLAAVFAFGRGKYKIAWALVAIGTLVKLYPIALGALFFIYQWRHQRWQSMVAPLATFLVVLAAGALPFWLMSHQGFMHAFTLQSGRNLQIESSYASVLFTIYALGGPTLSVFQGPVSWDLQSAFSTGIAEFSLVVMFFAVAAVCVTYLLPYARKAGVREGPPPPEDLGRLVNFSLLIVIMLLLASKVFSTQFIVWLVPFVPLVSGRVRHAVWVPFVAAGFLTYYIYPIHYWDLRYLYIEPMQVILLRNVLLGLMAFLLWCMREPQLTETGPAPEAGLSIEYTPEAS